MGMPSEIAAALEERGVRWREARPLAGDVSLRRYFRLDGEGCEPAGSRILAVYPPDLRDACRRFEVTAGWLDEAGVRAPAVVDADCAAGWMLVEDLGAETLFERFRAESDPWDRLRPWYHEAARIGRRIAALPREPVASLNPPLDRALLRRELDKTWSVFFEPVGLVRQEGLGRRLDQVLTGLCDELDRDPDQGADHGELVPCHRDFMVRNLVPMEGSKASQGSTGGSTGGGSLGVLDHQDLRLGPRLYDLASLLNDSLFVPPELEEEVLREGLEGDPSPDDWRAYRRAAVQRTLKAVGTFAGSGAHGRLIRPTLERGLEHLAALPEGEGIADELGRWQQALDDLLD